MSAQGRALHAAQEARKRAAEQALAELAAVRRELAQRDAALRELERERERLAQRVLGAREQATGAHDVSVLRWAHEHLHALLHDQAELTRRILALEPPRAELARKLTELEAAFRQAQVAERAVGNVLQKHEAAEARRRELAEEERMDELAARLPRGPHAK